jgi:hypothetical protein
VSRDPTPYSASKEDFEATHRRQKSKNFLIAPPELDESVNIDSRDVPVPQTPITERNDEIDIS